MVAYNFQSIFVDDIEARIKRQTIRNHRKRHARPGERIQLFNAMRTKACRKIIPDPVCIGVHEIMIDLSGAPTCEFDAGANPPAELALGRLIVNLSAPVEIVVNGAPLRGDDAERFARADGFSGFVERGRVISARDHMLRWWLDVHGPIRFEGVCICWEDQP